MTELEIIAKVIQEVGADAKWVFITYYIAGALTKLGVVSIIAYTVLRVMKESN